MHETYYRTGQAAKQLGVSSYHIRRLCETGTIDAEITDGQQWKVPAAEIARLKKEGVPTIPQDLEDLEDDNPDDNPDDEPAPTCCARVPEGLYAEPSDDVIAAAEEVKIVENRLKRRRLEREEEEVEDWFRERQQRHAAQQTAERQRAQAAQAAQQRQQWMDGWVQHALNSLPYGVPREVEVDVHENVQQALTNLQVSQPEIITRRLVDAAMEKALRPWQRQHDIRRAIESGIDELPWDVRNRADYAALKQRAWGAAVAAVGKLHAEASSGEMKTAASQAVQPMIREYEHHQACQRIVAGVYVSGATWNEQEEAKEALREVLAALPIGATQKQLEKAKQMALAPFQAMVAERQEKERLESEQRSKRRNAQWKACLYLDHIERYLQEEYDFDDGYDEMWHEGQRLRAIIEPALAEELMKEDMDVDEIREYIEEMIEQNL
jgi:excisionase family DNA binding protein